jgi:hypothetical protein
MIFLLLRGAMAANHKILPLAQTAATKVIPAMNADNAVRSFRERKALAIETS